MTTTDFESLGLPKTIVRALDKAGFTTPTPIQAKAIPAQLEGRDILGVAQTGSGKTAAFGLPIIAGLLGREGKRQPKTVGALILAPTRELAVQIEEMIRSYSAGGHITTALVLGGVSRNAQIQKLGRGVDVLVATPGRLCDLMEARKVRLDQTQWLVLDEADRMLDMGFIKPVQQIAAACAKDRKTALFSATMAPEVAKLAERLLTNPVRVEAAPQGSTVNKIEQQVIFTQAKQKRAKLNELLGDEALSRVIVFSRTKHGADKVAKNLAIDGFTVAAIHGNKTQGARQNALRSFRSGKVRILVATDIAARGIDVPNISHVINYELPDDPENYVHRIGRTGRNGASGIAITLVADVERGKLRDIERLIRRTLPGTGNAAPEGNAEADPRSRRRGGGGGDGKPKFSGAQKRARSTDARPHRGKPVNKSRSPVTGNKGWQVMLDSEETQTPAGTGQKKPGKVKRPRWNKRKKDTARANKTRDPRFGEGKSFGDGKTAA